MATRKVIDSIEVTLADSFVDPANKLAATKGNGEYRLYGGYWTSEFDIDFFGNRGFKLFARLKKSELIRFMNEMHGEYLYPSENYRRSNDLPKLWEERVAKIKSLPNENIEFYIPDVGPEFNSKGKVEDRIYLRSDDSAYEFLHSLPLSGTSHLKIVKVLEGGQFVYEFHLIPDFQGYSSPPPLSMIEKQIKEVEKSIANKLPVKTTVERLVKTRVGQNKFRAKVIEACNGVCAFTKIDDTSLMNAGHIKPWTVSNDEEKLDHNNGLLFTLTFDRLFNNGYISFTNDRRLIVSSLVSKRNAKLLNLIEGTTIPIPHIKGKRKNYMEYHRDTVFRS